MNRTRQPFLAYPSGMWMLAAALAAAPAFAADEAPPKPEDAKMAKVTLDEQQRLRIGGEPFFPIGIYSVPTKEDLAEAKALGFNTVHTYKGEGTKEKDGSAGSTEEMRAYLDAAHALGLKVFMGLPRYQVLQKDAKTLAERVDALKDHPALLVWYLFDEPDHQKVSSAVVQHCAEVVRKHDPNHPSVEVLCLMYEQRAEHKKNPAYVNLPDILMADPYPRTPAQADLSPVTRELGAARQLAGPKKPLWNVLQLHGKGPGGKGYGLLEPTWPELRNMAYQSLAAGVKGLTAFAYRSSEFNLRDSPEGLKNAKRITDELGQLAPVLLADAPAKAPLAIEKNDALRCRTFVHGGKTYLLAVNLRREKAALGAAAAAGGKLPAEAKVLFQDRAVAIKDGKLSEELEPLGVRVYEIAGE